MRFIIYLINKIKKIQRNFPRFYAYNTDKISNYTGLNYLKSLKIIGLIFDVTFVNTLLYGDFDFPELLQKIGL